MLAMSPPSHLGVSADRRYLNGSSDPRCQCSDDQGAQFLQLRRIDDLIEQQQPLRPRRQVDPEGAPVRIVGENVDGQADVAVAEPDEPAPVPWFVSTAP